MLVFYSFSRKSMRYSELLAVLEDWCENVAILNEWCMPLVTKENVVSRAEHH